MNDIEFLFQKNCWSRGIKAEFESKKFIILKAFKNDYRIFKESVYTPDFIIETKNGKKYIIEIKGYIRKNQEFYYKYIQHWMNLNGYKYMIIKYSFSRKNFFLYHKNIRKHKLKYKSKSKNFWDYIML